MKATIESVVRNSLCCGCGTCSAVCPRNAITMAETYYGVLEPHVDHAICINCGLCADVCPARKMAAPDAACGFDPFEGPVLGAYIGSLADSALLGTAQSGGIATGILLHALDTRRVEKVIVTGFSQENPLRPEVRLTDDVSDILDAQGSKYCPVALNTVLDQVARTDAPVGVVGLPCHIQGLRLAQKRMPARFSNIAFTIGLFCDRSLSYLIMDYMLRAMGLRKGRAGKFYFRSKAWRGYPGDIRVTTRTGTDHNLPREFRMSAKWLYTPLACRICFDKLNTSADISVGDAWGIEHSAAGSSSVLTRTPLGEELVKEVSAAGKAKLRPVEALSIFEGQGVSKRRTDQPAFLWAWNKLRISPQRTLCLPNNAGKSPRLLKRRLDAYLTLLSRLFLRTRIGCSLLANMPTRLPLILQSIPISPGKAKLILRRMTKPKR